MSFCPELRELLLLGWLCVLLSSTSVGRQDSPNSPPTSPSQASSNAAGSSDFSHARALSQQGKIDDAIAELQGLAAIRP
jgi:hypothetical protein